MVLARVAEYLFPSASSSPQAANTADLNYTDDGRESARAMAANMRRQAEELRPDMSRQQAQIEQDVEAARPPYLHAMLAGGLGGTTGDMLMPKYTSMGNTYYTIFRQEGLWRGLYGGVTPAFLGSFGGTIIFFGCYEWSKRFMLDHGVTPSLAYLTSGFVADLAASPLYVPTEVLKTRLQLQGRFNNPFFTSGYNYRSSAHALRTIYRVEGVGELFSGYKATLFRDLPFSALQFAFYEQEQKWAKQWVGSKDIGLPLEILTGASAGGMAGVLTCPMDVVKTRIQTELDPEVAAKARQIKKAKTTPTTPPRPASSTVQPDPHQAPHRPSTSTASRSVQLPKQQKLPISTSGPSTALKHHGQVTLDTESVVKALRIIYRTEGLAGWFRGVGPRAVWTSIQSGTMLVVYQRLLKWFDSHPLVNAADNEGLKAYSLDA
jgi:hypothetical protein